MLVNLLYTRWLGDIFLKSMADLIQAYSIFSLSYCNQHVLRTDTNVRKQLTFRESSCFLDIFTRPRESLETFPFRNSLFYILRSCYNQLLAGQKLYTLTRVTLESHVFAWELSFRKINYEWNRGSRKRQKSTVSRSSQKNWSRFWRIGLVKWKADSAYRIFLLSSRLSVRESIGNWRGASHAGKQLTCTFSFEEQLVGQSVSAWAKSRLRSLYWVCLVSIHKQARWFILM